MPARDSSCTVFRIGCLLVACLSQALVACGKDGDGNGQAGAGAASGTAGAIDSGAGYTATGGGGGGVVPPAGGSSSGAGARGGDSGSIPVPPARDSSTGPVDGGGSGGASGGGAGGVAGAMTTAGSGGMADSGVADGATPLAGAGGTTSDAGRDATTAPGTMTEGCGKEPEPAGSVNIQVGSTAHLYIVELPSGYDRNKPYPVLLAFHGAGLNAQFFQSFFRLAPVAGNEAIIVYFEANGGQWSYNRDFLYLDEVVTRLKSQYCIDENRLFATGHSAGGYFSNAIGVRRTDLVRAIAPISGGVGLPGTPSGKVAVWIAHGATDEIVPTSEGRAARDYWARQNGCDTGASTPVEPSPCVSYTGCDAGYPVHYCEYSGGHNIPSFAAQAVWDFFKAL